LTDISPPEPILSPRKTPHKRNFASLTSRDIIKASKQELLEHLTKKPRVNQQSGSQSTMRSKRLAQITMVTKGIKNGKLPPIRTPKQLDVFVFGEKDAL